VEIALSLVPDEDAPGRARDAVVGLDVPGEVLTDLLLLISELVTNAVVHAEVDPADVIDFSASYDGTRVRVDVRDAGHGPFALAPAGSASLGGRGFFIVDQLADRWGMGRDRGTRVWAEIGAAS
jgi:anti-sigma regulatory factor (Ser/Thr protein kinase)